MAYVVDTLSWAVDEADFRVYSGIAADGGSRDNRLEKWFSEACYMADAYMANPFVDSAGANVPHPPWVRIGVYEYVIASDTYFRSGAGGPVKSVKTGQLSETYATDSTGKGMSPMGEVALRAAAPHWKRSQIDLLISGVL